MLRTHYASQLKPAGSVKIAGWVQERRDIGSLVFLTLRDTTGLVQVTGKKGVAGEALLKIMKSIHKESVIAVEGKCVENPKAPNGVEIVPVKIDVISESEDLPIDNSPGIKTGLDKRLDFRCIDLRRPENHAIFKIQSTIVQEINSFFQKEGFTAVFTPCLQGVAAESGSAVFPVIFFQREAFLRQDPQLHRQLSIAGGLEKVYEIGPSWRAEMSHTTQHLTEHRTCAAEISFIENEYDIINLEQEMMKYVLAKIQKDCREELKMFNADNIRIPDKFPVLEFPDIYDILEGMGKSVKHGDEYDKEGEKMLADYVSKKYNSDVFFVNKFPAAIKPFYVMRDEGTPWARSIDLIFRGLEMSSGGQREHRYDIIMQQAREKGMSEQSIKWFADFFKYGVPTHGGYSIGIERFTEVLLGLDNIREVVLFPRDTQRLVP